MKPAQLICAASMAVLSVLVAAGPAGAQSTFPAKPVRIVVPYTPGGSNDTIARLIGGKLSERWGQAVVVENKPGANAMIGSEFVARAAPDGHTLLTIPAAHVTNPYLYSSMSFNPLTDLTGVSLIGTIPMMLAVTTKLEVKNLQELIAWGKANPGKLTFASSGAGSGAHLAGELFAQATDLRLLHVPYKGTSAALPDVTSGQVSMIFDAIQPLAPLVASGRLRALAMTSTKRWASEPNVPTAIEGGLTGFTAGTWIALIATARSPKDALAKVAQDTATVMQIPEVRERLIGFGLEPVGGTPDDTDRFVQAESAKWGRVIRTANIKVD